MKNIILLLLISNFCFAQNEAKEPDWNWNFNQPVSQDFPQLLPQTNEYLPLQNTYYELYTTMNNFRRLNDEFIRLNHSNDMDLSGTNSFVVDVFSKSTNRYDLKIKYNTFNFYQRPIVKSITIEGGFKEVAMFFIYLYNTKLSTNEMPLNKAYKYYKHDYAEFTILDNGRAKIEIVNTKYKNDINAFKIEFEKRKEEFKTAPEEVRPIEIISENKPIKTSMKVIEKEEKSNPIVAKKEVKIIHIQKKGNNILFLKDIHDLELSELLIKEAKSLKNGKYSTYTTITILGDSKSYNFKFNPL